MSLGGQVLVGDIVDVEPQSVQCWGGIEFGVFEAAQEILDKGLLGNVHADFSGGRNGPILAAPKEPLLISIKST